MTQCRAVDTLPCSHELGHVGDHRDVNDHEWPQSGTEIWNIRAERIAEQALNEIQDSIDAIPTVSLLLAALRAEGGQLPASEAAELDESFRREENPEADCICQSDLLARGGYRGGCPVHALR
jgi:hypothetical protein